MSHSWPFILITPSPFYSRPYVEKLVSPSFPTWPLLSLSLVPPLYQSTILLPMWHRSIGSSPSFLHNFLILICHHDPKIWLGYSYTTFSNYSLRTIIMVKTKPSWGSILKKTIWVVDYLICTLFVTRITPHILRLGIRFSNMYCIWIIWWE